MNEPFMNVARTRGVDGRIAALDRPAEGPIEATAEAPRRGRGPGRIARVALILAALGGLAWRFGLFSPDASRRSWPWRAETGPRPLVLHGNVDVRQVELSFKVEGRIAELAVDEGDGIKPGQVLARLDRAYFEDDLRLAQARRDAEAAALLRLENGSRPEEIARARAVVDGRRAILEQARLDFDRARKLVGRSAATLQEMEQTLSVLRRDEAELEAARQDLRLAELGPRAEDIAAARARLAFEDAAVAQAERRREDGELKAPGQGVILTRAREKGAIVKPGESVFTLTLTSPVWVRAYVPEPQLGDARPGMAVEVATDSTPSRTYVGRVGYVSSTAEFTPKAIETPELRTQLVYRTRIVIDDADDGLRQGMPVTVTVRVKTEPGSAGHDR